MNAAGTGKFAVVTGASSGIGFELAKILIETTSRFSWSPRAMCMRRQQVWA
jgi:NADP-dependent 3-hydroxy acid dehydrogenase YdfG